MKYPSKGKGFSFSSLTCMNAHVLLKTSFCDKRLFTQVTLELFLYFMES